MSIDRPQSLSASEEFAADFAELCSWSAGLLDTDIPVAILKRAALVFVDDLAAIVAARDEPELIAINHLLAKRSGPAEASLFDGSGRRLDRNSAALANGIAADWCELDEGYRMVPCHAGLYILPALLAEAETRGSTIHEILRALTIGYEITTRIARTFRYDVPRAHPHAALAAVGAASGVGVLRRLDASALARAVASASTMVSPGPYSHAVKGALVRNAWSGQGAWSGLQAIDWAECGVSGLPTSPYDVFCGVMGAYHVPGELLDGLGSSWGLADGYHKQHACCQYSHAAIDAAVDLFSEVSGRRREIAAIVVETHPLGLTLDNRTPQTTLAAKFSIPHIVAAALHYGHGGAGAFRADDLADSAVADLRALVVLAAFEPIGPPPNDRPSRIRVQFTDGGEVSSTCHSAMGGPDRPFSSAIIVDKVIGILGEPYPELAALVPHIVSLAPDVLQMKWQSICASKQMSVKATVSA